MNYLPDTSAFSDLIREHPKYAERLGKLTPDDQLLVCPIVPGELSYGLARLPEGKRGRDLRAKAARLLAAVRCEPVPPSAGDHYAQLKISRERAGLKLDENDLWIAACAVAYGATLVTRDTDFAGIEGLRVENWAA